MKRGMFIRYGLPALAIAMLSFAGASVVSKQARAPVKPALPPAEAPAGSRVAGVGTIEPESEAIAIGTHIAGIIAEVHVTVGENVKAGAPLFTVDDREVKSQLSLARAQLQSAKIAAADAAFQRSLYERVSDKRAISQDELERRRFAAELATARAKEAEAQIAVLETQLQRLSVKAPISGTVLKVNARKGEFAPTGANMRDPLMVMGAMEVMHVRVEIDETDTQRLVNAGEARGSLRGHGDSTIPLTFVRKEPLLVPKRSLTGDGNERIDTRVQEVIYRFDNSTVKAYPGQQMDVFVTLEEGSAP